MGSATSANVLLGNLQVTAANELNKDPAMFMAFSVVGGTIGKMISPQNIAVGLNGAQITGREGGVFKKLIAWYLLFLFVLTVMDYVIFMI